MSIKVEFKKGDKVYHHLYGWGKVIYEPSMFIPLKFETREDSISMHIDDARKYLSFTEYEIIKKGFSQEKALPKCYIHNIDPRWRFLAKDSECIYIYKSLPNWCDVDKIYTVDDYRDAIRVNGILKLRGLKEGVLYKIIPEEINM